MRNDFLNSFISKPVRESSGSRSANRFDYQKNWSLCELLDLHTNNEDYLMVFEHHDDVVVFDSQTNPSSAVFYQVKTKKPGNWTVGSLTKSKSEDSSQSILGKLYSNYLHFPDNAKKLIFTSNHGLSAKLKSGEKAIDLGVVSFSVLADKDKEKIHQSVEPEEQDYCDIFGLDKIFVEKNDLRVSDHTAITKGKLVEFFENLHPNSQVHISLVYKTFFDEIRRKTNYEETITQPSELYSHKSIGRSNFEGMINTVLQQRNDNELWADANHVLTSEHNSFMEIKILRSNWQQYIVDRMNVENDLHIEFQGAISAEIDNAIKKKGLKTFNSIKDAAIKKVLENYEKDFNEDYMKAAILYEVMKDDPIPETNKKFTDKTE